MSRQVDVWWNRSGWLPALEVIKWPRLEKLRKEHEAAVKAHDSATEDPGKLEALVDVVERATTELSQSWSEVETLCGEEHEDTRGPAAEHDQHALARLVNRTLDRRVLDGSHILPTAVFEARKALHRLAAATV